MAMNTPYLGSSATVPANLNTSYISTGLTEITSALSVWGPVNFLSGVISLSTTTTTFSSISVGPGALTGNGQFNSGSSASFKGFVDFNSTRTQAGLLSYQTTASATSLNLPDGAFGIYFESVTSCRLCFRSGATTYTWIATTGAIL